MVAELVGGVDAHARRDEGAVAEGAEDDLLQSGRVDGHEDLRRGSASSLLGRFDLEGNWDGANRCRVGGGDGTRLRTGSVAGVVWARGAGGGFDGGGRTLARAPIAARTLSMHRIAWLGGTSARGARGGDAGAHRSRSRGPHLVKRG